MEYLIFWPLIPVVIVFLIWFALRLVADLRWGDGGHTRRHIDFMADGQAAGIPYGQLRQEKTVMEEFARIRREASEAVRKDLMNWKPGIDNAIRDAFDRMKVTNPDLLPALADMVTGLDYGHILYPDQARRVDTMMRIDEELSVDLDEYAAMRRVRPG